MAGMPERRMNGSERERGRRDWTRCDRSSRMDGPMVINTSSNENEPVVWSRARLLPADSNGRVEMGETSLFREHAMQTVQAETHDLEHRK